MPKELNSAARAGEAGSAFIYIILAVVLFGALMFTFTRSARQGGSNMSDRQLQLTAADITGYAQEIERAVNKVMLHDGISENQLSFDNPAVTGYANTGDCGSDACRVFTSAGGAAEWETPSPQVSDNATNWVITGGDAVPGVGDDATADLVMLLPDIKQNLCVKINDGLNVTNPGGSPPVDIDGIDQTKFTGAFPSPATARISDAATPPVLSGIHAACFKDGTTGIYIFYEVLSGR